MRSFLKVADEKHWNYNLIEAVDQPWKRGLEGTVGGYWGIFNTDLQAKFSFTDDIAERHDGKKAIYAGLIGALLLLVWSLALNIRAKNSLASMMLLGGLVGISTLIQVEYLITACRVQSEWLALGGLCALGLISLLSLPAYVFKANQTAKRIIQITLLVILLAAFSANYLLMTDGRYRDFAISLYALPVIELSIGLMLLKQNLKTRFSAYRVLGTLLIASAAFCLYKEPSNVLAMFWLALCALVAWTNWPIKRTPSI